MAVNLPLADVPFRDVMAERLGLPVVVDNDANVRDARRGALRRGARARATWSMLTIGTGIGGGLVLDGRAATAARPARRAELGHMVIDEDGPPLPGQLPQPRLPGGGRLGHGARRARARRAAARSPTRALGRALAAGARSPARSSPSSRTTATRSRATVDRP